MKISEITIKNFRIYKNSHTIKFNDSFDNKKNIYIIAGKNGYGKTSFLTALLWCLYGRMIAEVEESYKKNIYETGGYKNYLKSLLNREKQNESIEDLSVSVQIEIKDIYIPSVPCSSLIVKREYFINSDTEKVTILIDGYQNELTNQVGADLFINDFILSREIAKFFFFDAERIVSLAEIKSIAEKRQLSLAYSDILGIRKYEVLKINLENVRIKLKRKSADIKLKEKIQKLQDEIDQIKKLYEFNNSEISELQNQINEKRVKSDQLQESLIREGSVLSLTDLKDLIALQTNLKEENIHIKSRLKDLLELVPFAMAGKMIQKTINQILLETVNNQNNNDNEILAKKLKEIEVNILSELKNKNLDSGLKSEILKLVSNSFQTSTSERNELNYKTLLNLTIQERSEFEAIYNNLKDSFALQFQKLVKDERNNRISLAKTTRKIQQAESKGSDIVTKKYKEEKQQIDNEIKSIVERKQKLFEENGAYQNELSSKQKIISELVKNIRLDEIDDKKDEVTKRLINELNSFILKLKKEKAGLFEMRIKNAIFKLMHKNNFISDVEVVINNDIIDILLLNERKEYIEKETLSKGEQQLYATAVLKALVEESGVEFPVFIDSPLQKFDKTHSDNIISYFYPTISKQVILFPLLEKELSVQEYNSLSNKVNQTFIIDNSNNESKIIEVESNKLFQNQIALGNVQTH